MAQDVIFKFKPGSRIKGNAEQVGAALETVRETMGGLTASNVVAAARPKDSTLHRYFLWNEKAAAAKYRETQARHLMASVIVSFRDETGHTTAPVHAFVALGEKEDRYMPILAVMNEAAARRKLLAVALSELGAFQKKYQNLSELAAIFQAIEQTNKAA
jgi:hypothetical protein